MSRMKLVVRVVAVFVDLGLELIGILGFRRDETDVAILRGKAAAAIGPRRAHQRRPRALDRLRRQLGLFHLIEAAGEIERFWIGPQPRRDLHPFLGHIVAAVVIKERDAEHVHLRHEPAGDEIEREAAAADVIDGRGLLGGEQGMHGRNVRSGEHARIGGRLGEAGGPGEHLKAFAVEIGLAAKTFPAPDRHNGFELHFIREAGKLFGRRPLGFEQATHFRNRAAAGEVGGERAELERGIIEEGIGRRHLRRVCITGHRQALSEFRPARQTYSSLPDKKARGAVLTQNDPAIHAAAQLTPRVSMDHRVKPGGDGYAARHWSGIFLLLRCRTRATSG